MHCTKPHAARLRHGRLEGTSQLILFAGGPGDDYVETLPQRKTRFSTRESNRSGTIHRQASATTLHPPQQRRLQHKLETSLWEKGDKGCAEGAAWFTVRLEQSEVMIALSDPV